MLGTISRVFVEVLRRGNFVDGGQIIDMTRQANLGNVVLLNNEYEMVVNCDFPIIGVFAKSSGSDLSGYIGNETGFSAIIQIVVITEFDNSAASADNNIQYDYMDLSGKVKSYLALADFRGEFKELNEKYGFSFSYRGIDAEQPKYKTTKQEYRVVQHNLVYYGKGFLRDEYDATHPTAPIETIDQHCNYYLVPADELPPIDKDHAKTWRK